MKKTFIALFSALAMVLIGCSQPTGGDIPDWENPPSEIGGGDSTDPAEPEEPVTKFTVTFNAVYGENPASIEVEKDAVLTAEQLKELTFEGFVFKGWFDGATEAVAGKYKVTRDVTLKAEWVEASSTDPDPVDPEPEDPVADPDPVEPEDPVTDPTDPESDPEESPYEELLKDIENAEYHIITTSDTIFDIVVNSFDNDADILTVPDVYKKSIIAKFLEEVYNKKITDAGVIYEGSIVYCYTTEYFIGFKATEMNEVYKDTSSGNIKIAVVDGEDIDPNDIDIKIFKKGN